MCVRGCPGCDHLIDNSFLRVLSSMRSKTLFFLDAPRVGPLDLPRCALGCPSRPGRAERRRLSCRP